MSRRMDYTIEFDAPAEKIYQDFTSREYWQTLMDALEDLILHHIKQLFDDEVGFTADWISKHH